MQKFIFARSEKSNKFELWLLHVDIMHQHRGGKFIISPRVDGALENTISIHETSTIAMFVFLWYTISFFMSR